MTILTPELTPEQEAPERLSSSRDEELARLRLAAYAVYDSIEHLPDMNIEGLVDKPETKVDPLASLRQTMDDVRALRANYLNNEFKNSLMDKLFSVVLPGQSFTNDHLMERERQASHKIWSEDGVFMGHDYNLHEISLYFKDDENAWYYSERILDPITKKEYGNLKYIYEVIRDSVVIKVVSSFPDEKYPHGQVTGQDLERFLGHVARYRELIIQDVYASKPKLIK